MPDDDRPDLSRDAVNRRLRSFVAEHRAKPAGGPFAESDALLCAWAEDVLAYQEKAAIERAELERRLAEAEAEGWRRRGERLQ